MQMDSATKDAYKLPSQWQTLKFVPVLRAEGCIDNTKQMSHIHLSLLERWHEQEAWRFWSKDMEFLLIFF